MASFQNCQRLGTKCFFLCCSPNSHRLVSGLWPLNTVDMLCIGDLAVPCCSCPIIELETGFTGGESGHSLTTELSCREESRAGWVLYGWLGGNKLEAGCAEPWTRHSHPTHSGQAQRGPLYLDRETHTGQQIMPDVNCYCLNVWWVCSFLLFYDAEATFTSSYLQPKTFMVSTIHNISLSTISYSPSYKQPQNPGSETSWCHARPIELPS